MTNQEILDMQAQLEEIGRRCNIMRSKNYIAPGCDAMVYFDLARIENAAQLLYRRLSRPDVVERCREDALAQTVRVHELLVEFGFQPSDDQLVSIGYACELAGARIRIYREMASRVAQSSPEVEEKEAV